MKNMTRDEMNRRAQEAFNRWFDRSGHWIYASREVAMDAWRRIGINGLAVCPEGK